VLRCYSHKPSRKGKGFDQPIVAHEHWHIDISYLNIGGTFYYMCSILDGYSRCIVNWDIRETMTEQEVEVVLQRAHEKFPNATPRIISDNGPQFSGRDEWRIERFNCGFRGSKGSVHEGGIRVPLLIRWPAGLDGNRHYHDLVHFTDWLPTLAAATGIDIPAALALDGQNILPALRGEGGALLNPKRFWQWSRGVPTISHNAAMRDGFWKLVVPGDASANSFEGWRDDLKASGAIRTNPQDFPDGAPDAIGHPIFLDEQAAPPLLFNLASDPLERNNLANVNPGKVSRMVCELENWFDDVERDRQSIPDRQFRSAEAMRASHR
jgi:hypothetical protein